MASSFADAGAAHGVSYAVGRQVWGLVLPDAQADPSCSSKSHHSCRVASLVASDLGPPIRSVSPRRGEVLRAAVPEAPIYEHCHTRRGKDKVDRETLAWEGTAGDPIAETQAMDCLADR